jgi:hypothetical protein
MNHPGLIPGSVAVGDRRGRGHRPGRCPALRGARLARSAEVAVPRDLFRRILEMIGELRARPIVRR